MAYAYENLFSTTLWCLSSIKRITSEAKDCSCLIYYIVVGSDTA